MVATATFLSGQAHLLAGSYDRATDRFRSIERNWPDAAVALRAQTAAQRLDTGSVDGKEGGVSRSTPDGT